MQLCSPQLASVPAQQHACAELWEPWSRKVLRQLLLVIREGEDSGREGLSTCVLEDLCGSDRSHGRLCSAAGC